MSSILAISDWRRNIAELYSQVRAAKDPVTGWNLWRDGRAALFMTHPASPTASGSKAPPRLYPYDPQWRFVVEVQEVKDQAVLDIDTGADGVTRMRRRLRTDGLTQHLGQELDIYWLMGYGGGVFLPYRDASSHEEAYEGGRYILDSIKGADLGMAAEGEMIIDFNFSYNPSCAFSDEWVCPLAPPGNYLNIEVKAGEKIPI